MATYEAKICPACGLLSLTVADTCLGCKEKYPKTAVGQPPVPIEWRLTGGKPNNEEVRRLSAMRFSRRPPSFGELKKALITMIGGSVAGAFAFFFGLWVIRDFVGPGVFVFGYGAALCGPLLVIISLGYGLSLLLSNPRKKAPYKAFRRLWEDAYFDTMNLSSGNRYEKPAFGFGATLRSVPKDVYVPRDSMTDYIDRLQQRVNEALDEAGELVSLACKGKDGKAFSAQWAGVSINVKCEQVCEEPVLDKLCRLESAITITKYKTCSIQKGSNSDTYRIPVSAVRLCVDAYYIRNGKYWFPYDLMPRISPENTEIAI